MSSTPITLGLKTGLAVMALSAAAFSLAVYLATHDAGSLAGCSAEDPGGCAGVLNTKWSQWMGFPVSMAGAAIYALIFLAALAALVSGSGTAWTVLFFAVTLAGGAAVWFSGLQFFRLDGLCPYCLGAQAFGLASALLVYADALRHGAAVPARAWLAGMLSAGVVLSALIGGQIYNRYEIRVEWVDRWDDERAATFEAAIEEALTPSAPRETVKLTGSAEGGRSIKLLDGKLEMVLGEYPILGDPNAEKIVAIFSDYTCPGCRMMHQHLEEAMARYENQFAVVVLPMALDAKCNPSLTKTSYGHRNACLFSKMGLAIWGAKPEAFREFNRALYEPRIPPERKDAVALADELVGPEALDAAMSDGVFDKMLYFSINLFYSPLIEEKVLPVLLTPKGVQLGNPDTKEDLFALLEDHLELDPPAEPEIEPESGG